MRNIFYFSWFAENVILKAVADYFQVKTINLLRRSAIYLCRKIGGYQLKQIAKIMGDVSYKTISIYAAEKDSKLMSKENGVKN